MPILGVGLFLFDFLERTLPFFYTYLLTLLFHKHGNVCSPLREDVFGGYLHSAQIDRPDTTEGIAGDNERKALHNRRKGLIQSLVT